MLLFSPPPLSTSDSSSLTEDTPLQERKNVVDGFLGDFLEGGIVVFRPVHGPCSVGRILWALSVAAAAVVLPFYFIFLDGCPVSLRVGCTKDGTVGTLFAGA